MLRVNPLLRRLIDLGVDGVLTYVLIATWEGDIEPSAQPLLLVTAGLMFLLTLLYAEFGSQYSR